MSNIISTNEYVKFIRGTPTAFEKLNPKSTDTLYFISEAGASTGKLYLGSKLISGGEASISELGQIIVNAVKGNDILVYDAEKGAWVNKAVTDVVSEMVGASDTTDGRAGLVPRPISGDQDKVLTGAGRWESVSDLLPLDSDIFVIRDDKLTLAPDFSQAKVGDILQVGASGALEWVQGVSSSQIDELLNNRLIRKIVDSVDSIDTTADDATSYIYMVRNSNEEGDDFYDEYIVIGGRIEKIGNTSVDLSELNELSTRVGNLDKLINGVPESEGQAAVKGLLDVIDLNEEYITKRTFENTVGDLSLLSHREFAGSSLVDEINVLSARMTWQEIVEEGE